MKRKRGLFINAINEQIDEEIEWTIVHEGDGNPDYHVSILKEDNRTDGYDVIVHSTGFGCVRDSVFIAQLVKHHYSIPAVLIHAAVHSYRYAEPADP